MKKTISLLLVLSLLMAFAPAAFADKATEGILKGDGHLYSCPGTSCSCDEILFQAEKEAQKLKAIENLKVWMITWRDEDGYRHDRIITEVNLPYDYETTQENQKFLDENEAVKNALLKYFDEEELAEKLYRTVPFINGQVEGSFSYLKGTSSKSSDLEYRIMDADFADKVIFSRAAVEGEMQSLTVRVEDLLIELPEDCYNKAFTMGLNIAEDGSAEIMLIDDNGTAIEGAKIVE